MHAGDRDRLLAGNAVVQSDNAATVHAPRHFVFVFTSGDATVAFDATLCVTNKFHACHYFSPLTRRFRHAQRCKRWSWTLASW